MPESKQVLDASALLATIQQEPGAALVQKEIHYSMISTVNWSEVIQKLDQAGVDAEKITHSLLALGLKVIDFTLEDARLCATLWPQCKIFGLSFADRACLATALRTKSNVITADKIWQNLNIDLTITCIR